MQISRLYIRIFLFFIAVLLVTVLLILILFLGLTMRGMRNRFAPFIEAHSLLLRDVIESQIKLHPDISLDENHPVGALMGELSTLYGAQIWITSTDGTVLLYPADGKIPPLRTDKQRVRRHFILHEGRDRDHPFHITVPFSYDGGKTASVHLYLRKPERRILISPFLAGLAVIGFLIAVLLLPLSRKITRPLEKLRVSVQRISDGDLTVRAEVNSADEIGALIRAFNGMAETIERLVKGQRELTANISHELRSPLTRIRVAEELLRNCMGRDVHECGPHLDEIRGEIEEMDGLIGRMLTLFKLDMESAMEDVGEVDVSGTVKDLIAKLDPSIQAKSLLFDVRMPPDPVVLLGSAQDIRTALSNLLDNGVKFCPERGALTLLLERENAGVLVVVKNDCDPQVSIDPDRIFEPFVRAKGAGERGSGLGLAITKRIVDNHGGSLAVEQGEGTFQIRLQIPYSFQS
jgi:two-component system sensor histidine kinase CpxA